MVPLLHLRAGNRGLVAMKKPTMTDPRVPSTNTTPHDPRCDKCGAPITTGMMAVICPHAEQCEFWVPEQSEFLRELRGEANAD